MVGILLHGDNHFNVRRPLPDLVIALVPTCINQRKNV